MTIKELHSILTGVSGEYFVAAELSRREYIASITLRKTRVITERIKFLIKSGLKPSENSI